MKTPFPWLVALCLPAGAATLVQSDFNSATTPYANTATAVSGITTADLVRGTGTQTDSGRSPTSSPSDGGAASFFIRGAGLNISDNSTSSATVTATTQQKYLEFTLSAAAGLNLTSLTFDAVRDNNNAHNFRILVTSNLTGHTFDNRLGITSPAGASSSLPNVIQSDQTDNLGITPSGLNTDWGVADNATVNLNVPTFQGVTSATFRIYAMTINNPTVDNSNILRFDNIILNGELVPEPSIGLLALAGGLLMLRRKR